MSDSSDADDGPKAARSPRRSLADELDDAAPQDHADGDDMDFVGGHLDAKYQWDGDEHTENVLTGRLVATREQVIRKCTRYHGTGQGVPYHVVREVSILKGITHRNIIKLVDVIHEFDAVSLIYEYLPRDLRAILDERCSDEYVRGPATCDPQLKHYYMQLVQGVAFLHSRCILHRDLKPNDLRIDDKNVLKIANFRLARTFTLPLRTYTHEVVTLWYRAPEILLGKKRYDTSVDLWSAGCLLAEVICGDALFRGDCEIDQLFHIFKVLGTPTKKTWPELKTLPDYRATFPEWDAVNLQQLVEGLNDTSEDLLRQLLVYDCSKRISARKALEHPYFDDVKQWVPPSVRPPNSALVRS
eukprot:m.412244 g.412244  ORF g.412244 m.412244 type:complete len:357 (+) comp21252_c0_seq2:298-1368(+)